MIDVSCWKTEKNIDIVVLFTKQIHSGGHQYRKLNNVNMFTYH